MSDPFTTETVEGLVRLGLTTDGAHHKQWCLQEIADLLSIDLPEGYEAEEGSAP
jgi:hypothetical protein